MDGMLIVIFGIVLVLGGVLLAVMSLAKNGKQYLDVEKYRVKWLAIEQSLKPDQEASYHMALLNADKLLDKALQERGYEGDFLAFVVGLAGANGDNFALLGFLFGGVGDDDPAALGFFFFKRVNEHPVAERLQFNSHGLLVSLC